MKYLMGRLGTWERSYLGDLKLDPPGELTYGKITLKI